jgi:integrase
MAKHSRSSRTRKSANRPPKPYAAFPLYAHPLGYWSKKINGTIRHFGRWGRIESGEMKWVAEDGDWATALKLFEAQYPAIKAGREPNGPTTKADNRLTVKALCNEFLTAKYNRLQAGRISPRTFAEYKQTTDRLMDVFGGDQVVQELGPADFNRLLTRISKKWGLVRLGNEIIRTKSVFKHGRENGLIKEPIAFGSEFKQPDRTELRKQRAKDGKKFDLKAADIHKLLDAADTQLRAMVLVGVNCGFGNNDVATLPLTAVDLDGGWVDYPRPKTGIERRCPLWPETIAALRLVLAERPKPNDEAKGLVFVRRNGKPWLQTSRVENSEVSQEIAYPVVKAVTELMKSAGVHRAGLGFYTLRHVFRSVADGARDWVAVDRIMGHQDPTMGGHYRDTGGGIDDSRLQAVAQFVRQWLFPQQATDGPKDVPAKAKRRRTPKAPRVEETGGDAPRMRLRIVG